MPKLSELLLTSQDTNPTSDDAIPTLKEVGGEATNKMVQLKDLPVSTAQAAADALKVNKAGDTMTAPLTVPAINNDTVGNLASVGVNRYSWDTASFRPIGARDLGDATNRFRRVHVSDRVDISGAWQLTGTGFPDGVVSAPVGSIYIDKAATAKAFTWYKEFGSGNTGWQVANGNTRRLNVSSLITNGWGEYFPAQSIFLQREGAFVRLVIDGVISTSATSPTICQLPVGFRPPQNTRINFQTLGAQPTNMYRGYINTDGEVVISGFPFGSVPNPNFFVDQTFTTDRQWPTTLPVTAV